MARPVPSLHRVTQVCDPGKPGYPLRGSRLALETGVLRFHGILRVINTLCPYLGLV